MKMTVNFNNLRKQAAFALDDLTEKLNEAIIQNDDQYALPNEVSHGQQVNLKGYVLVDVESIQKHMDDLRMMVMSIAGTFEPESEEFKDLLDEIDENRGVAYFNEEA